MAFFGLDFSHIALVVTYHTLVDAQRFAIQFLLLYFNRGSTSMDFVRSKTESIEVLFVVSGQKQRGDSKNCSMQRLDHIQFLGMERLFWKKI